MGEGAFGVVSVCKRRATGEEYAVKMVDKASIWAVWVAFLGPREWCRSLAQVETPVEAIKKEADILQSMVRVAQPSNPLGDEPGKSPCGAEDHPNIVKFHGVYYERCFVCIVMDKLDGGDLVEGLQRHLKDTRVFAP